MAAGDEAGPGLGSDCLLIPAPQALLSMPPPTSSPAGLCGFGVMALKDWIWAGWKQIHGIRVKPQSFLPAPLRVYSAAWARGQPLSETVFPSA